MRRLWHLVRRRPKTVLAVGFGLVLAFAGWLRLGPLPVGLVDLADQSSTTVRDRHGETLYEMRTVLGLRTEALDAARLPPRSVRATMAAEDIRFEWHVGIDPIAIARAAWRNLRSGQIVEGGSTITQQVAKLLLARQAHGRVARGWRAKVREAIVAIRLEHRLTKPEIVALYLTLAPYGNQIAGAERAARAYFGRPVATLTLAESAFLAALPQQPSRFNPWRDAARAAPRQARVLDAMRARAWISDDELAAARAEQLTLHRDTARLVAPHFVERVLAEVSGGARRPARIDTTLDAGLQRTIQGIIDAERPTLDRHHASNVAIAVLDNRTGDWLAWEGSGRYGDTAHGGSIDGVVSPRQPGSALKPFTYAAAFERGGSPAQVLADVPSQFPTAEPGVLYSPRNYDGQFRGPLLAREALAGSENVPAVALASEVGVPAIARLLRRAGLTTLDHNAAHYGLGLTLGNAEVRLDELVAAYAMLARGGEYRAPQMIAAIDGAPRRAASDDRVLSPRTAFWITDVLADPEARAYVFGRGGSLEFPFPVAAKTGTSQSYFDNWVVGYTREVTVGVWVGNFDRTPLRGSSGVTGAGPIFHAVMLAAVERVRGSLPIGETTPILEPTSDVRRVELCAVSGMAPGAACPTRATEWAAVESPGEACTWHHATDTGVITAWPAPFRRWARESGAGGTASGSGVVTANVERPVSDAAPVSHGQAPPESTRLTIVRPLAGAVFLRDPTLRAEFQALTLESQGGAPGSREWFVNGTRVGETERDGSLRWPMAPGTHAIVVRDTAGAAASARVVVR